MNDATDRARLLGLSAYEPTERLRADASCTDPRAYHEFLEGSRSDAYWLSLAAEIPWSVPPTLARDGDDWFPGARFNLGSAVLDRAARTPLVESGDRTRSLERDDLERLAHGLVSLLADTGLAPGQRVCVALSSGAEAVAALAGCWLRGLAVVPADLDRDGAALVRRATESGCRLVVTDAAASTGPARERVRDLPFGPLPVLVWNRASAPDERPIPPPAFPADHPAVVYPEPSGPCFTIGAAGVAVTGLSSLRHLADGRGAGDSILLLLPLHHSAFASLLAGALLSGQTVVLASALDPAAVGGALRGGGPRVASTTAELAAPLARDDGPRGVPGPALLLVEGESVEPGLIRALRESVFDGGTHVVQVLSRPEVGGLVAGPGAASTPVRAGSVSLPAPGFSVAVVDAKGERCPPGHGGRLALEGPVPSLAAELSRGEPPHVLGVRARTDREGALWVMGELPVERPEEERVPLPELEAVIAAVDGVAEAAVVRFPDVDGAIRTRAFVAPVGNPALLDRLKRAVTDRLGEKAVPDAFQFVTRLPHSRSGKLLRSVLRRVSAGEIEGLDDVSVVADPEVVRELVEGRKLP
jgi:acyl-coenzyme A synthetase/AMP-(fatty) acid ligase